LTEEEKLQGFHQYVTSGHYPIPMTKLVEDAPSLTKLDFIDDKPISDEELLQQFNISHLSPKHQEQARKLFLKHKNAFSRHDYDLGRAKDIEMDIELVPNTKKPQLQSYRPMPHTTRGPMKEILTRWKSIKLSENVMNHLYLSATLWSLIRKIRSNYACYSTADC
jgi:hypothetical protein